MSPDWAAARARFPALRHWTYLNTASFGQLPDCSIDACAAHFRHREDLACGDFVSWFDDADRVRDAIARLIGGTGSDIAFAPNASSALAVLLHGIDWRAGDRVVTLAGEFPNLLYGPASLARVGVESIETTWGDLPGAITPRTRLVLLSTVNYTTGFAPNLETLADSLRERGLPLFLDATQSAGALPVDVTRLGPAMLACDGYKWLLSPNGAAFFHVPAEVRAWLRPNVVGWRSDAGWRDVDSLHHGAARWPDGAERYEGGMIPFPLLFAMEASVKLILDLGVEAIAARALWLAALARDRLRELGADIETQDSPIVAARFPAADASALVRALAADRILVAARHGLLRVSPHFYNDEEDVGRLVWALRRLL